MHNSYEKFLHDNASSTDVVMVGLGFMGFGFLSVTRNLPGIHVSLVISRRPAESKKFLEEHGFIARIESNPGKIKDNAKQNIISVSDDLSLISTYENKLVFEVTGTVPYGTEVALKALESDKSLITMNPELQATVGTQLKQIADKRGLIITDTLGDQPGCLARMIREARSMGFKIRVAGNMKRFMNHYATQKEMQPWADDKGLAVRQTTSFTDGSKQAIEMTLVSNYFGMKVLENGMKGPKIDDIKEAIAAFKDEKIPKEGVVDFGVGLKLFPGVFLVAEHHDPYQQKYLRYLNMGEGPHYVLFDPYHLCHLEVPMTIAGVVTHQEETINNGDNPTTATVAIAKRDIEVGETLDGIGGDLARGDIFNIKDTKGMLPMGVSDGAKVTKKIAKDSKIFLSDVNVESNAATKLLGLA